MAGLLEALMNGGMPTEDDPKGALLADLLKRLEAGNTQGVSASSLMPNASGQPQPQPEMAPMRTPPNPWETSLAPGPTQVPDRTTGQAYTAPEASIVPDDMRKREAAARLTPTPAATVATPSRQAASFDPTFQQKASDFFTVLGGGKAPDREAENITVRALMGRLNLDQNTATAMVKSPQMAQLLFGNKTAPQIVKIPGPYGQEVDMVWNSQSGKLEPLSSVMADPGQVGRGLAPGAASPAQAPAASPAQSAIVPPVGADVAVPAPPTPMPLGTATAGQQTPADKAGALGNYVVGPPMAKMPEGYVQRMSPDGKGYLYAKDGTPISEAKATVEKSAENRAKSNEDDRNKALAAIDTVRKVQDVYQKLDTPFNFATPYKTGAGMKFDTYGDVVGPYAIPTPAPATGGPVGAAVSAVTNVPSYLLQTARNLKGLYVPEVEKINSARNELETALSSLQGSRVKELFGSQNLSDADREAAAKTVGTLTAQNAAALKGQLSVGEKDSFTRIAKALDDGLISPNDVPQEIMSRGIKLGMLKPDLVFKRSR